MAHPLEIRQGGLQDEDVIELLREHLKSAALYSPPESIHALDLEGLRAENVTFWTARRGGELAGCGALIELDSRHGEVKSMRTASTHLRQGVASAILRHILDVARARGYAKVSLETGSMDAFAAARALYARFGFEPCPPFAHYTPDSYSTWMTLNLGENGECIS
ncbi:MAG: GNAT family N-acetyltransferase [Pirellulales bacterium]|nr:GNAT family N-acetyltransferase [Pirellulales bacterium]